MKHKIGQTLQLLGVRRPGAALTCGGPEPSCPGALKQAKYVTAHGGPKRRLAAALQGVERISTSEATNEVDKALELFTDDIVWESPTRNLVLRARKRLGRTQAEAKLENIRNRGFD